MLASLFNLNHSMYEWNVDGDEVVGKIANSSPHRKALQKLDPFLNARVLCWNSKTLYPQKKHLVCVHSACVQIWHHSHIYTSNYRVKIHFFVFKQWLFFYNYFYICECCISLPFQSTVQIIYILYPFILEASKIRNIFCCTIKLYIFQYCDGRSRDIFLIGSNYS